VSRFEDWPTRLDRAIREAQDRPAEWGKHDCCLFACDCVQAMTGVDPARKFRGRYKTKRGAFGAVKRFAGGGIAEAAEKIAGELGVPEVPPATAQRGDVVLFRGMLPDGGETDCLGVVSLDARHVAAVPPEGGVVLVAVSTVLRAWRI
jgi:hypothetical protein